MLLRGSVMNKMPNQIIKDKIKAANSTESIKYPLDVRLLLVVDQISYEAPDLTGLDDQLQPGDSHE
jgi:hypothetical protein